MELIRKVLLAVEACIPHRLIDGYSQDQLRYHQLLLINEGLVDGCFVNDSNRAVEVPTAVMLTRLTWAGHDFIEAIGDETRWGRVKAFLADSEKQITIETVKAAVTILFGCAKPPGDEWLHVAGDQSPHCAPFICTPNNFCRSCRRIGR
ncbi:MULTISPECIES: DUF2513 domain-containing protein [unclassified Lysobacter]|uniref:DUF2513 domain-containing protein n=1 Tax=unclassified Lysobacter TaxID=2635362 RepID=UPI001BE69CB8|nr:MULTISPECIES: DUF2513 domain-containing protein [unclassified Lysobacter]MBT2750071.1 DUF2513 domain-containing protein [Lysobacter sp. ISL-50]MBT2775357.1 DUF2513 domain-containing protein [Lysobacter sp. ISL-54]MBT2783480.1 DUF2513 domain-containing protein [Lysobacter sp. ISL-52]